jgi:predicted nuclease with TOPRIM domain
MSLKQITNKLRLSADASEHSIMAAIDALQTRGDDEKVSLEGKITALEKKIKDDAGELDKLKTEWDTLYKKVTDLEDDRAKKQVQDYVNMGRIKNDAEVIAFWTEQFKANEILALKQIGALPFNRTAPVLSQAKPARTYTAAGVMALIDARVRNTANLGPVHTAAGTMAKIELNQRNKQQQNN